MLRGIWAFRRSLLSPPHVSARRAYREATVSVPGVRPSYPGGAAFRSRR